MGSVMSQAPAWMETGLEMIHNQCQQASAAQGLAGTAVQGVKSLRFEVVKRMQECRYQSSADSHSHSVVDNMGSADGTVAGMEGYITLPAVDLVDRADSC